MIDNGFEKVCEKKSLRAIMQMIDLGLVDFDSPEQIQIVSSKKSETVIRLIEFEMTDYFEILFRDNPQFKEYKELENNIYTYVVFVGNKNENTLMCIELFELIKNTNLISEINSAKEEWNLDTDEWILYRKEQ